jgi:hypothetical protein
MVNNEEIFINRRFLEIWKILILYILCLLLRRGPRHIWVYQEELETRSTKESVGFTFVVEALIQFYVRGKPRSTPYVLHSLHSQLDNTTIPHYDNTCMTYLHYYVGFKSSLPCLGNDVQVQSSRNKLPCLAQLKSNSHFSIFENNIISRSIHLHAKPQFQIPDSKFNS